MVTKLTSSSPTEPAALVKVYAGERNIDVLHFAQTNNLTTIGGADPHVGIGGLVLGGGHGPLTAKYGLAADQVVEMDVVTADGEYLTVNSSRSPDLFWALRGVSIKVALQTEVSAHCSVVRRKYVRCDDFRDDKSVSFHLHQRMGLSIQYHD